MLKIEKKGRKGIYYVQGTVAGIRVRQSLRVDSKTHAETLAAKLEQELLDEVTYGRKHSATFADAVLIYKQKGGSPRFLERLVRYFGRHRLADIDDGALSAFILASYPNAKPQTINRQVYTPLIAVLNRAADAKLCARHNFRRPKQPKRPPVEFMRDDQLATLLLTATVEERALLLFLSFEGARNSEVCRVNDPDVDWGARTVLLPLTKGDPHQVVLPPVVYDALLPLRGRSPLFGCKDRWALNRAIARACKRAGVPTITSHKIGRHSFAARLLRQGHSLKHVQEAGGWSVASMPMLARTYAHLEPSAVRRAVLESGKDLTKILDSVAKIQQIQAVNEAQTDRVKGVRYRCATRP